MKEEHEKIHQSYAVEVTALNNNNEILQKQIEILKADNQALKDSKSDSIEEIKSQMNTLSQTQGQSISEVKEELIKQFSNNYVENLNEIKNQMKMNFQSQIDFLTKRLSELENQIVIYKKRENKYKQEIQKAKHAMIEL